jgi:hypothetical protein
MHPEFTRQLMFDHVNELRHDAEVSRRVRRPRRHLRNPLRRSAA